MLAKKHLDEKKIVILSTCGVKLWRSKSETVKMLFSQRTFVKQVHLPPETILRRSWGGLSSPRFQRLTRGFSFVLVRWNLGISWWTSSMLRNMTHIHVSPVLGNIKIGFDVLGNGRANVYPTLQAWTKLWRKLSIIPPAPGENEKTNKMG